MTILRSRKIIPKSPSGGRSKTLSCGKVEPPSTPPWKSSSMSPSTPPPPPLPPSGQASNPRRWSLRLASKSKTLVVDESRSGDFQESGEKRKIRASRSQPVRNVEVEQGKGMDLNLDCEQEKNIDSAQGKQQQQRIEKEEENKGCSRVLHSSRLGKEAEHEDGDGDGIIDFMSLNEREIKSSFSDSVVEVESEDKGSKSTRVLRSRLGKEAKPVVESNCVNVDLNATAVDSASVLESESHRAMKKARVDEHVDINLDVKRKGKVIDDDKMKATDLGVSGSSWGLKRRSERLANLHGSGMSLIDMNLLPPQLEMEDGGKKDNVVDTTELVGEEELVEGQTKVLQEEHNPPANKGNDGIRRYSREEKGKDSLVKDNWLSIGMNPVNYNLKSEEVHVIENAVSVLTLKGDAASSLLEIREMAESDHENHAKVVAEMRQRQRQRQRHNVMSEVRDTAARRKETKQRFLDVARSRASKFANFQPQEREDNNTSAPIPESGEVSTEADRDNIEDWPGPFSTAMKIIRDRIKNAGSQWPKSRHDTKDAPVIEWTPSVDPRQNHSGLPVPSLQEMCLKVLAENAEAIVSLDNVPDIFRNKLSQLLSDTRKMDSHFMNLLARGSPTEIRVKNCSWITEEQITDTLQACDMKNLKVLQLDLCGRCMPDHILHGTLARSPNSLTALVTISLRGACRVSDSGLSAFVASAPALRSINLSQCSLITATGINALAHSLASTVRELYLDDCQSIDPMLILPGLKKLQHLEVLSVSGIQTVCNSFICEFVAECGANIKELVLANCWKLTDTSLKAIAEGCSRLCALDLVNLYKLTDSSVGYLVNGGQSFQILKFCRNAFSDEAIAAFLEASGASIIELSLNNVKKVGPHTAISLAKKCSTNLLHLDLSWCRNLTDEALGRIVDCCSSLKVLKMFGCTQITNRFLEGHRNPFVQIIGLKMTPLLQHVQSNDCQRGPLRY